MSEIMLKGMVDAAREFLDAKQAAMNVLAQRDAAINEYNRGIADEQRQIASQQRNVAVANEQLAKEQKGLAEKQALVSELRARAAEARVKLGTDPIAGLQLSTNTMRSNLASGEPLLAEVYASVAEALAVARLLNVFPTDDFSPVAPSSIAIAGNGETIAVGSNDMLHLLDRRGRHVAAPIPAPDGFATHSCKS